MHPMMINREPAACVLIRLTCERCGPVRMALATPPDAPAVECPYCISVSPFDALGEGRTTRLLPYFELEANLVQVSQEPPGSGSGFRRLVKGQTVIFCEETNILHFATIDEVWVNAVNISPAGKPSISFLIRGLDTGPIPHSSGAQDRLPPFWCLPEEFQAAAAKVEEIIRTLSPEEKKAAAQAKRAATIASKKALAN